LRFDVIEKTICFKISSIKIHGQPYGRSRSEVKVTPPQLDPFWGARVRGNNLHLRFDVIEKTICFKVSSIKIHGQPYGRSRSEVKVTHLPNSTHSTDGAGEKFGPGRDGRFKETE